MEQKVKFETLHLKADTMDKLRELSQRSDIPMAKLIAGFIDEVYILTCTFQDSKYNLSYDTDLIGNVLKTCVSPRVKVTEVKMDAKTLQEESKAGVLEVIVKPKVNKND